MGNLSAREKFMMLAIGLILIVFGLQMLVLKPQQKKTEELEARRAELQQQKDYYDSMITASAQNREQIEVLNGQITVLENSFLPVLNTESIQQYVLDAFESNGCPYLVSIDSEDLTKNNVVLPDNTVSNNFVMIKRINVQYSTTDGFCVPQYGSNPTNTPDSILQWLQDVKDIIDSQEDLARDAEANNIEGIVYNMVNSVTGYDEFIATLQEIEAENPDCVRINKFSVRAESGYLILEASIDFISANIVNRVSDPDMSPAYVTFAGNTPAHSVNQIGLPLYPVSNPDSAWAGVFLVDDEVISGDRPFATYYSSAILKYFINNNNSLSTILGIVDNYSHVSFDDEAPDDGATPDDGAQAGNDEGEVA